MISTLKQSPLAKTLFSIFFWLSICLALLFFSIFLFSCKTNIVPAPPTPQYILVDSSSLLPVFPSLNQLAPNHQLVYHTNESGYITVEIPSEYFTALAKFRIDYTAYLDWLHYLQLIYPTIDPQDLSDGYISGTDTLSNSYTSGTDKSATDYSK